MGKTGKMSFEGKSSRKLSNGQTTDYSGKRKWPKGFMCPCTGVKYHNIQMFISICSRSQVSVYRTIGPLVTILLEKIFEGLVPYMGMVAILAM